jgi:U5 small nuclear ribonucleoprotein component
MEEDAQPITSPIIAPIKTRNFDITEKETPKTTFNFDFLAALMMEPKEVGPKLVRNIAVVGQLHHGKTGLIDMFIQ